MRDAGLSNGLCVTGTGPFREPKPLNQAQHTHQPHSILTSYTAQHCSGPPALSRESSTSDLQSHSDVHVDAPRPAHCLQLLLGGGANVVTDTVEDQLLEFWHRPTAHRLRESGAAHISPMQSCRQSVDAAAPIGIANTSD